MRTISYFIDREESLKCVSVYLTFNLMSQTPVMNPVNVRVTIYNTMHLFSVCVWLITHLQLKKFAIAAIAYRNNSSLFVHKSHNVTITNCPIKINAYMHKFTKKCSLYLIQFKYTEVLLIKINGIFRIYDKRFNTIIVLERLLHKISNVRKVLNENRV